MSAVFSPRGSNMKKISRLFVKKKKVGTHILHLDVNEAKNPEAIVLQVVSKHLDLQ